MCLFFNTLNVTSVDCGYPPSHVQRSCLGAALPVGSLFWILEKNLSILRQESQYSAWRVSPPDLPLNYL